MKKIVLILSGGMDSTTLCYDLVRQGFDVNCLSFNYGQKHRKELLAAMKTTARLGLNHEIVDLSEQLRPLLKSALTDIGVAVPEGHYADENMKATVVPNRNMIMLSIAAGWAISIGADAIAYAAHAGDHAIYPDCRPEFRDAMRAVLAICHFTPIDLYTPYINIDKGGICTIGRDLELPYQDTWTCYKGGEEPCTPGPEACGACNERAEAFEFAGIPDPLLKG